VQENVGAAIVRHDEAVALGHIEPLDDAGELDDGCRLVSDFPDLLRSKPQSLLKIVRRHGDAVAPEFRLLTDAAANLFIKDNRRVLMEKD
jgi:hypothetical protein